MKKPTTPEKRQQFFNWNGVFIGILILLLLNTLLAPYIGSSQIKDSDYGTFISELNKGKVSKVVIKDGYVYYDIPAEQNKKSAKSSKTVSPFLNPQ
ncbi:MAG: ATP-dependent metallopeptidase FtsH/Yme1/Tma family protein, partial [Prevotella sp.]